MQDTVTLLKQIKLTLIGGLVATGFMLGSVNATAKGHGGHGKHKKMFNMTAEQQEARMQKRLDRMAKKLSLTERQKTEAKAIFSANKAQKQALFAKLKTLHDQLKTQRVNKEADANLEATHDAMYDVKKELRKIKRQERRDFEAILSSEQLAKIAEMKGKFGEGRHGRSSR